MQEALNIINNLNISKEDYIVLACSYGPDSMCLLDILNKLHVKLVVAHVNHKLRKESDKEYQDLEKYCQNNNIIFEGSTILKIPQNNIEAYARNYRYNFFYQIIKKYQAKYLFTAHHGDDLIETILMRISRGSSLKGYAGFKIITDAQNYQIIRPLIYLTKDDIIKYNQENKIPYAIDKTNYDEKYTRNKYRHQVLPILKQINPNIHQKFIKFSNTINECSDYLEKETNNLYSTLYHNNSLDLTEFNLLPVLLKKELLRKILLNIYQNNINIIDNKHLDLILNLCTNSKPNSEVNLPNNITAYKYYNILEFSLKTSEEEYDYLFNNYLEQPSFIIEKIDKAPDKSNYYLRLSSEEITLPLHIRSRKTGDKISLKNSGTKKVGQILSENKLPQKERNTYPILTDAKNNILWIPGVKKSKFDKQSNEDYDIILKYIKKEKKNEKEK
jgi:tRNA(Ile)-lysidine synthetase-like protein